MSDARRYTLAEVQAMRAAIHKRRCQAWQNEAFIFFNEADQRRYEMERELRMYRWQTACEEELLTYITAGVAPEEVIEEPSQVREHNPPGDEILGNESGPNYD